MLFKSKDILSKKDQKWQNRGCIFTKDCKRISNVKDGYFPTSLSHIKNTEISFPD